MGSPISNLPDGLQGSFMLVCHTCWQRMSCCGCCIDLDLFSARNGQFTDIVGCCRHSFYSSVSVNVVILIWPWDYFAFRRTNQGTYKGTGVFVASDNFWPILFAAFVSIAVITTTAHINLCFFFVASFSANGIPIPFSVDVLGGSSLCSFHFKW